MRQIEFLKMHGLGNDFVVLDGRLPGPALAVADYRAVGDRRRGVGYDQFLTIEGKALESLVGAEFRALLSEPPNERLVLK